MSANPQRRERLEKVLETFSDENVARFIYIEESNLYFYLVIYGMLILMIRKSDLLIIHEQYMDRFLHKRPQETE